jgi:hypothetical protein
VEKQSDYFYWKQKQSLVWIPISLPSEVISSRCWIPCEVVLLFCHTSFYLIQLKNKVDSELMFEQGKHNLEDSEETHVLKLQK